MPKTVTTEVYLQIFNEFFNQLTVDELITTGHYQQGGPTCHNSNAFNVDKLGTVFQNLEKRIQVCLDVKGDHFQHRL
jgi:hypothetical protein